MRFTSLIHIGAAAVATVTLLTGLSHYARANSDDPPTLGKYTRCAGGVELQGNPRGLFRLTPDGAVLLAPTTHKGKKGFYIYNDDSANFFPLPPSKVYDGSSDVYSYVLKTGYSRMPKVWFDYHDSRIPAEEGGEGRNVVLKHPDSNSGYEEIEMERNPDDEDSRRALSGNIVSAVNAVPVTYKSILDFNRAHRQPLERANYARDASNRALEYCATLTGDRPLVSAVIEAQAKMTQLSPKTGDGGGPGAAGRGN